MIADGLGNGFQYSSLSVAVPLEWSAPFSLLARTEMPQARYELNRWLVAKRCPGDSQYQYVTHQAFQSASRLCLDLNNRSTAFEASTLKAPYGQSIKLRNPKQPSSSNVKALSTFTPESALLCVS